MYEGDEVIAEFDGAGHLRRQYVLGPGVDLLDGLTEGGFASYDNYLYARDPVGTIVAVVVMYVDVQVNYRFQAFGEPVDAVGAIGDGRCFAGREYDAETGLYYIRRRHYDPTMGRFLQRDPLPIAAALSPYV